MRWIFAAILIFVLAKAAYGEDMCPKKSTAFAFCIQGSMMDHTYQAKDRTELEQLVSQDCTNEMKEYADCDGIDKTAFATEFIRHQVEFFKKDGGPKAVARRQKGASEALDSNMTE